MYDPLSLTVTVTLTFDLETPNSIGGNLLVMTNHHTKLKDPWDMSFLVIERTRFVYRPTYRRTDRHVQRNISPLLRRGA